MGNPDTILNEKPSNSPVNDEAGMTQLWMMVNNQARSSLMLLPLDKLNSLRDANEHSQAIGPLLDPTMFIQNADAIAEAREVLDATIAYITALTKVYNKQLSRRKNS